MVRGLDGQYTIAVTNSDNGCALENWGEGESTSNIPFTIEQEQRDLHGTLNGVAAIVLGLAIGTNQFKGQVNEGGFEMTAYGTIPRQQGNCAFTLNAKIQGEIVGDALSGTLEYAPAPSNNPIARACTARRCKTSTVQGTRSEVRVGLKCGASCT